MADPLSSAEQLAVAVLKGDREAALPLCDEVLAAWGGGARPVQLQPTVNRRLLTAERGRFRVAVFLRPDVEFDGDAHAQRFRDLLNAWLAGGPDHDPTLLFGVERLEIFELPEARHAEERRAGVPG